MFDVAWYKDQYPEVSSGNWVPSEHYLELGARSGLAPSRTFDGSLYTMLHPEIVQNHINPLVHFTTAKGTVPKPLDQSAGERLRCCVLLHLFYDDLWDELTTYLSTLDGLNFSLFVNIPKPAASPALQAEIKNRFPQASIIVSPNEGRDIGGFFRLLALIDFADYDVFLLVHSKRSPHCGRDMADAWRRGLLNALLGTREIVRQNFALLATHPTIGVVAAASARRTDLGRNRPAYDMLLDRMTVAPCQRDCEYVTGTMMLIRGNILRRLYQPVSDLTFENGDNMPLDFHVDGQLAHAVERCIGAVVRASNQQIAWRPVSADMARPRSLPQPVKSSGTWTTARYTHSDPTSVRAALPN